MLRGCSPSGPAAAAAPAPGWCLMKVHWVRPGHLPSEIPCRAWRHGRLRSPVPGEVTCLNCLALIRIARENGELIDRPEVKQ